MKYSKALVVFGGWMGNLMWIVPLLRELNKNFESLYLIASEQQELLAESLTLDSGLERKVLDGVFIDKKATRRQTASQVRDFCKQEGIDCYIDLVGKWKSGIYIPASFARNVFMPTRDDAKESWFARLTTGHPFARSLPKGSTNKYRLARGVDAEHMVDAYLRVAELFGSTDSWVNFRLNYDQQTIDQAERIIKDNGLKDGNSVVLHVGSAQYSKIWPITRFRELALRLLNEGVNVAVMGAEHFPWNKDYDRKAIQQEFTDIGCLSLCEGIPLMVNAYLLSNGAFNVLVGNDSWAGHMTAPNQVTKETQGAIRAISGDRYFKTETTSITIGGPTNLDLCNVYDPTGRFNIRLIPGMSHYWNFVCQGEPCGYDRLDHICRNYGRIIEPGTSPCMRHTDIDLVHECVIDNIVG